MRTPSEVVESPSLGIGGYRAGTFRYVNLAAQIGWFGGAGGDHNAMPNSTAQYHRALQEAKQERYISVKQHPTARIP